MRKKIMVICKNCGKLKPLHAKELCRSCYVKQNLKICKNCNELKPHVAFGLCKKCYRKQLPKITCKNCGRLMTHGGFGLCKTCLAHSKGLCKPMSENKSCSQYLGIFINEQLLSKIFKNVKQMSPNNPGYDFKCNKGKKVDAKSSVTHTTKGGTNYWSFVISKNKIADYFFCVAYSDRKDPKPLHMWIIPVNDVNNKERISISESTLCRWDKYEQPIDKALLCCNNMKGI